MQAGVVGELDQSRDASEASVDVSMQAGVVGELDQPRDTCMIFGA
jgi:hypothetical protein